MDGGEERTASPETKWEKRMNRPQAQGNKLVLFFNTATTNEWWGTLEVFGLRSGAQALILCGN